MALLLKERRHPSKREKILRISRRAWIVSTRGQGRTWGVNTYLHERHDSLSQPRSPRARRLSATAPREHFLWQEAADRFDVLFRK